MWKSGRFRRSEQIEYAVHYLTVAVVYGSLIYLTSVERVLVGLLCSATLHSLLLWYAFAIKTHEGYSTGPAETRTHNYFGRFLYWFSFGLSMHRLHHMQPKLAWIQMAGQVPAGRRFPLFTLHKVVQ
jgi:fatty acid desaturase